MFRDALNRILRTSRSTVFFGGAGMSTQSGIPDFRSADGIYSQRAQYPPETIISHSFFLRQPELFFAFYKEKMVFPDAQPNAGHQKLAELERAGRLSGVITQNIDGLHQRAGSQRVLELHGSVHRNYCMDCAKPYGLDFILASPGIPRCEACGGIVRPDVVLYEESLDSGILDASIRLITQADTLIIGGTSLTVYPAAGLSSYFHGNHLVLINKTPTPADSAAELAIHAPIADVLAGVTL